MAKSAQISVFDPAIVWPAVGSAFAKLHPRVQIRNPVMFVVEIVATLTAFLFAKDLIVGGLTYFPALALGPIVEQVSMNAGTLF